MVVNMIYKCKNCGSNIIFNPEKGKMVCPSCQSEDSEEVIEHADEQICNMCGAQITPEKYASATKCEHCKTWVILNSKVSEELKPDLVLPFYISKEQATEILRKEFKSRMFTPSDFLSQSSLEELKGSYVPFWLFDYFGKYIYEGVGTKIKTWRTGNTEYTETSKYQIRRNLEMDFEKIPADASFMMEDGVMDLMEPYKYEQLTGFDSKYLSGFYGEIYNDSSEKFESRAKQKANDAAEKNMQSTIDGYASVTPVQKNLILQDKGKKYALFPIWVYTYRFKRVDYKFYVNGQTGKLVGKTPISFERVIAVGLSMFVSLLVAAKLLISLLEVL